MGQISLAGNMIREVFNPVTCTRLTHCVVRPVPSYIQGSLTPIAYKGVQEESGCTVTLIPMHSRSPEEFADQELFFFRQPPVMILQKREDLSRHMAACVRAQALSSDRLSFILCQNTWYAFPQEGSHAVVRSCLFLPFDKLNRSTSLNY